MNFKALWIKFEKFTTVITFKKFERHNYGFCNDELRRSDKLVHKSSLETWAET